jgi:MFS family permease
MVIFGYCLLNFGCLFFVMPVLPEVIESVATKENLDLHDPTLNDKASGIHCSFESFGQILAPILGGFMNDNIGYRYTNDSMMVLCFTFFLVYLFFNYLFCQKPQKGLLRAESPVGFDSVLDSQFILDYDDDLKSIDNHTIEYSQDENKIQFVSKDYANSQVHSLLE